MIALRHHVARLRQQHHHLLEILKIAQRLLTEDLLQVLERDRLEVAGHQVLLELAHPLHLAQQIDSLVVAHGPRRLEQGLVEIEEIFQVAEGLVLGQKRVEVGLGWSVLELVELKREDGRREKKRKKKKDNAKCKPSGKGEEGKLKRRKLLESD